MTLLRVAIVDDHPLILRATEDLVRAEPEMTVVGTARNLAEARRLLEDSSPDVVVLDVRLGQENGLALIERARQVGAAVVVLSSFDYPEYVDAAWQAGASGYILKSAPLGELTDAIRHAHVGAVTFQRRPLGAGKGLSGRERQIVLAVADGETNEQIAQALGLSRKTVEAHLRRLFERYSVSARSELVALTLRRGWLETH